MREYVLNYKRSHRATQAHANEVAAAMALGLGSLGNIRTETMRVFPEAELRKIVGSLK